MRKFFCGFLVGILFPMLVACGSVTSASKAVPAQPKASICFYTNLPNGPAKMESDAYCSNGRQLAWSMYAAAVKFAEVTHTIVGYPEDVFQDNDWAGRNNTMVYFSSGIRGEHYDDGVVRFYNPQTQLLFKCGNGCPL